MYCPRCGSFNDDGSPCCGNCGQSLSYGQSNGYNYAQNYGQNQSQPPVGEHSSGISTVIKIASIVIAALYVFYALARVSVIFSSIGNILNGYVLYGICRLMSSVLAVFSRVLMAVAVLFLGFRYNPRRGNPDSLFLTVGLAGILRILFELAARLLMMVGASFNRWISVAFGPLSFLRQIVYVVLVLAIFVVLFILDGTKLFSPLPADGVMGLIRRLPDFIMNEMDAMSVESAQKKAARGASQASGAVVYQSSQSKNPQGRQMKEDRSLILYYVLGILTCGIYQLYVTYTFARDINIMCRGDGEKETAGLVKYIIFTLITCGIYHYYWHYKLLSRVEKASSVYDFQIKTFGGMELCAMWMMFTFLGLLISVCGVGLVLVIYAQYTLFTNINSLSKAYNAYVAYYGYSNPNNQYR